MPGDIVLDELHQNRRHIDALCRGGGLEGVVEADFYVDVHAPDSSSFLLLDPTHLLPIEVSLYGFEYRPPVPRMIQGPGGRAGSLYPGIPADPDRNSHLLGAHAKHRRHQAQLFRIRNTAGFDGKPLFDPHASQAGYSLQRKDTALPSLPHKDAEQLAPDLTDDLAGLLFGYKSTYLYTQCSRFALPVKQKAWGTD